MQDEMVQASVEPAANDGAVTVPGCQWQDISTAIMSDKKLIGLVNGRATTIYAPFYATGYERLPGGGCRATGKERRWSEVDRDSVSPCKPTHWMPLPPRPGDRTDSGEAHSGSLNQALPESSDDSGKLREALIRIIKKADLWNDVPSDTPEERALFMELLRVINDAQDLALSAALSSTGGDDA